MRAEPCGRAAVLVAALAAAALAPSPAAAQRDVVQCARCHADRLFLVGKAPSAPEEAALYVPPATLEGTPHQALGCAACHPGPARGYPHDAEPRIEACETCHPAAGRDWAASIHAANVAQQGDAASCVDCHGAHAVYRAGDRRSPVHALNVAETCGSCHADERIIGTYFSTADKAQARTAVARYYQTVHGAALTEAGLVVSATCNDCHGAHRILAADSTASTLARRHVAATCGACHGGVQELYAGSAHGVALAEGRLQTDGDPAPVCTDCHQGHEIVRADEPEWFVGTVEECGSCHEKLYETYFGTYHGKVTRLGFGLTAKCSDCHTAHDMRAASDPESSVFPANLVTTCARCHQGANVNFTKYYAHGDPTQRAKYPLLFWPYALMTALLVSVMAFFGLHAVLWLTRRAVDALRGGVRGQPGEGAP